MNFTENSLEYPTVIKYISSHIEADFMNIPAILFLLTVISSSQAFSQTKVKTSIANVSPSPLSDVLILFLTSHAQDVSRRAAQLRGATDTNRAQRLKIDLTDLVIVDQLALTYAADDTAIHKAALQYLQACKSAKQPLDPVVVHSFTTRRVALATAAFSNLRSMLPEHSYRGLKQFLNSSFQQSFKKVVAK